MAAPGSLRVRAVSDPMRTSPRRGRVVRRVLRSLDGMAVVGVFCVLMVLPSGVTRLAGSDTIEAAGLQGTVSVLQIRGPPTGSHGVGVGPPGEDRHHPRALLPARVPGTARDPFASGLAEALNKLLLAGYPPFVFASVDGNGERHADTEWANSDDRGDLVMDRVVDAAIPAVEGTHMRDAAHRAIAGFSMGGYGAMNIAMRTRRVRRGRVHRGLLRGKRSVRHVRRRVRGRGEKHPVGSPVSGPGA